MKTLIMLTPAIILSLITLLVLGAVWPDAYQLSMEIGCVSP